MIAHIPLARGPARLVAAAFLLAMLLSACGGGGSASSHRQEQSPGSLDSTFGDGGIVVTPFAASTVANDAILQPDGRILAVGVIEAKGSVLVRYGTDGALDPSFGSRGKVLDFGQSGTLELKGLALQADGRIVAAGSLRSERGSSQCALIRLNDDGSRDLGFGAQGLMLSDKSDFCARLVVQADGRIVTLGHRFGYFVIERFHANGVPDTSFGDQGAVAEPGGRSPDPVAIALDANGKIVVTGTAQTVLPLTNERNYVVFRFDTDGRRDTSFGVNGVVASPRTSTQQLFTNGSVMQPDGKIVVMAQNSIPATAAGLTSVMLTRLASDGALDAAFGANGVATAEGGGALLGHALAIQSNGQLLAAASMPPYENESVWLSRFNSNGSLDKSFGTDGTIVARIGDRAIPAALLVQIDQKVIVFGASGAGGTTTSFFLARYFAGSAQ